MTGAYNTASAFLDAGNYDSAKKIAENILDKAPDDIKALILLAKIEKAQQNYDQALSFIHAGLRSNPLNQALRKQEILIFMDMDRKRKARLGIKQFETDFPLANIDQDFLKLIYESHFGSDKRASQKLQNSAFANDALAQGIFYTNSGALFAGQRSLLKALENDPVCFSTNSAFAVNQFALSKPWAVRKAAKQALNSNPTDFSMRFLKSIALWSYLPPIYYVHLIITAFFILSRRIPALLLILIGVLFAAIIMMPFSWFHSQVEHLTGFRHMKWVTVFLLIGYFSSFLLLNERIRNRLIPSKRKIQLKDY